MISFSEKWLSKILQNKIFFSYINFLAKIFRNFFFKKKFFFEKNFKKRFFFQQFFFSKIKFKKFFEINFVEKILCVEKNILFCKIFESHFSENEIFENWSMAVGIWLFLRQLQRPITRMCLTQMKYFIPLNDSTHQDLWRQIYCD